MPPISNFGSLSNWPLYCSTTFKENTLYHICWNKICCFYGEKHGQKSSSLLENRTQDMYSWMLNSFNSTSFNTEVPTLYPPLQPLPPCQFNKGRDWRRWIAMIQFPKHWWVCPYVSFKPFCLFRVGWHNLWRGY